MTGPMQDHRPARDNETEHADLSEKAGEVAVSSLWAMPQAWKKSLGNRPFPWARSRTVYLRSASAMWRLP